jgi:hypothetical protein
MILIKTFDSINIPNNSLILCDIDDTVFYFPEITKQWWTNKFDHYYKITSDFDLAENLSLTDWQNYIKFNFPEYTDKKGFLNFVDKINLGGSKLIFITARQIELEHITILNFNHLQFDVTKYQVHYIGHVPKGEYIKLNICNENCLGYNKIIFIDDIDYNIQSVKDNLLFCNLECYKFEQK